MSHQHSRRSPRARTPNATILQYNPSFALISTRLLAGGHPHSHSPATIYSRNSPHRRQRSGGRQQRTSSPTQYVWKHTTKNPHLILISHSRFMCQRERLTRGCKAHTHTTQFGLVLSADDGWALMLGIAPRIQGTRSGKMEIALWVIELSVVVGLSPWLTSGVVL